MHRLVLGNSFAALVAPILLCVVAHKLLSKRRAGAHRNAEDPNPGAPSPSVPPIGNHYDVFLSFRGVDTRRDFADDLYRGLIDTRIHVFKDDDELHVGERIGPDLLEAMKNSKILIPIISPNYASSKRCLDELVHMMEYKKGRVVFPIFYKVEPADVQHQIGTFGDAFHYYGRRFDQRVMEKWKQALTEVGSLGEWEREKVANGHEGESVKWIVRRVLNELKKVVKFNLVGIYCHVEEIMILVNMNSGASLRVGIHGRGGGGKTTLAKVIYHKLSNLFEHRSFIANVRESCKRNGILYLQNQLVADILRDSTQFHNSDEGKRMISSRLKCKKVLIVLDDVGDTNELKALAENHDWFGSGSRIIVTTRRKSVLDMAGVDIQYEHKPMDWDQSLILFSRHAFLADSPPSEFVSLSHVVVSTVTGHPLALELIGSLLCGKGLAVWADTIEKIQTCSQETIMSTLRICYEALEEDQKQMFLDIACFLVGSDARVASYMWDSCGFYTRVGIEVLRSLSFINIGNNHELKMHDQLRELGREIVLKENYSKPCISSRLWNYEKAFRALKQNKGTGTIQVICLEDGNMRGCAYKGSHIFTNEQFKNLPKLRFLDMSDVNLVGDFKGIFSQLRWLKWGYCSGDFAADNFHPRELVILDLSKSLISDDWGGWSSMMMAEKLKVLNLTSCRSLESTSYLSAFKRLEILIFRDCGGLEQIDPCIGDVETLVSLDLSGCQRLKKLPPQVGKLEQLKELLLDQTMILEIPPSIGSLKKLEMLSAKDCKLLLGLPDSIGRLVNLRCFSLRRCHELTEMPDSIGMLQLLTRLDLSGCFDLRKLPLAVGKLEQLKELLLDQIMIEEFPSSIGSLKKLEILSAKDCKLLRALPDSIGMLQLLTRLDLSGCLCLEELPPQMGELEQLKELLLDQTMIREIPSSFGSLKKLETLSCKDCKSLLGLPYSIGGLVNLSTLVLSDCFELVALPHSIWALRNLEILNISHTEIKELPSGIGRLIKLRDLDASRCTKLRGVSKGICNLSSLQNLDLHGCKELLSLPELPSRLKNLSVTCQIRCKSFLLASIKLEILRILDCKFIKSLDVSQLHHLRKLSVEFCNDIFEIRGLDKLKYLERLTIKDCDLIKRLDLSKPEESSLKYFAISRCSSIEILPDWSSCTNLISLVVKNCEKVTELRGLEKLEQPPKLDIYGCNNLERWYSDFTGKNHLTKETWNDRIWRRRLE